MKEYNIKNIKCKICWNLFEHYEKINPELRYNDWKLDNLCVSCYNDITNNLINE